MMAWWTGPTFPSRELLGDARAFESQPAWRINRAEVEVTTGNNPDNLSAALAARPPDCLDVHLIGRRMMSVESRLGRLLALLPSLDAAAS